MKKIIDANVIVRFLVRDDEKLYLKSKQIFEEIENKKIEVIISEGVVLECFFVLTKFYGVDKKNVIKQLKTILFLDNVINSDKLEIVEALTLVDYENIDFIDALLITKATFNNYEVLSFDKKLNKILKKYKNEK